MLINFSLGALVRFFEFPWNWRN